jgi:hypothetical protein
MSSRTPSGVEICSPDTFDYYDISNAVYQRLEDRGLSTHRFPRCQVLYSVRLHPDSVGPTADTNDDGEAGGPFASYNPKYGAHEAEAKLIRLQHEQQALERQQQHDISQLRGLYDRERSAHGLQGGKRKGEQGEKTKTGEAGYIGLKVTGAPPHAVVQV